MTKMSTDRRQRARRIAVAAQLGFLLAAAGPTHAQQVDGDGDAEVVDRIAAVVGDTVVLQSEIQQLVFRLQAQNVQIPTDPLQRQQFLDRLLQQKINEMLVVIHARDEGITVSAAEVNDAVDQRLEAIRGRYPNEAAFLQALQSAGMTVAEFRIQLGDQTRAELLTQRFLQGRMSQLRPTPISEEEIRQQFELQKAAFGPKPASVTLKQVIVAPAPDSDSRLLARERAEQALSRLRSGERFERLAREYSDDQATRTEGGELGWVRRGQLLPTFEEALFQLGAGETSGLVESPLGYHIIRVERVRGSERFARHILIQAEIAEDDYDDARQTAEEVARQMRAGADPDSLIQAYGDPQERGTLSNWPRDRLPEEYQSALEGAAVGDVVGPIEVSTAGPPGRKWSVVKVMAIDAGGEYTLDDVRENLRRQVQQEKMLEQLMDELRSATYIDVRI